MNKQLETKNVNNRAAESVAQNSFSGGFLEVNFDACSHSSIYQVSNQHLLVDNQEDSNMPTSSRTPDDMIKHLPF